MATAEPRAHHYVPQCWLAGFTENGEKDGRLWVTDLERKKQWPSSPPNAGHQRDFNRLEDTTLDPLFFEKQFSYIEAETAPIFKDLYANPRWPTPEELATVEVFIALQFVRVPAFRPFVMNICRRLHRAWIAKALRSPKSWERALRIADIPPESKGTSYQEMCEFVKRDDYSMFANTDWFLVRGVKAAIDSILPSLQRRYWGAIISSRGDFIASDNPVTLDGPRNTKRGFVNAEVVMFPLNKYVLLSSFTTARRAPRTTYWLIASQNTFAMMNGRYLYSAAPDFVWLSREEKCVNDWTIFNRNDFPK